MPKTIITLNAIRHSFKFFSLFGATTLTAFNIIERTHDKIKTTDDSNSFLQHTKNQQQLHPFSGMHTPFIADPGEQEIFQTHFPEYSKLLPTDLEQFKKQQASKTPVKFRPLSELKLPSEELAPEILDFKNATVLVVGGLPALISSMTLLNPKLPDSVPKKSFTYINDESRNPISAGSAFHLEYDAQTEAPTTHQPIQFFSQQIKRSLTSYIRHESIAETGFFPWRTLDWVAWMQHPQTWYAAFTLALAFQLETMATQEKRQNMMQQLASRCKANEKFYEGLNNTLKGGLLKAEKGSFIVARDDEEVKELLSLKENLAAEGRTLNILTREKMIERFGFAPEGQLFGEKTHDRILSPNATKILAEHIKSKNGTVINGVLTTVYSDGKNPGGIAEYQRPDGSKNLLVFSQLILSLGTQAVLDQHDKPLFNVISARGVSVLAHIYVPKGSKLPPVTVCGATNHVTKLSEAISIIDKNGSAKDLYLARMTAGACITPNVSEENSANYDGSIGLGLMTAVQKTFGSEFLIKPLAVYGCNRQVSQYGQLQWITPYPGVSIQYGAGGGGLTRAPELAIQQEDEQHYSIGFGR